MAFCIYAGLSQLCSANKHLKAGSQMRNCRVFHGSWLITECLIILDDTD